MVIKGWAKYFARRSKAKLLEIEEKIVDFYRATANNPLSDSHISQFCSLESLHHSLQEKEEKN
jgi:hypothetical protein